MYADDLMKKILFKIKKHGNKSDKLEDTIKFILGRKF